MTERGQAWQNGYAERFVRILKEEEVYLSDYTIYTDLLQQSSDAQRMLRQTGE